MKSSESLKDLFTVAMARFDEANAQDPHREIVDGLGVPRELLYSQRVTLWVSRLAPNASEPLQLAARAQHLCRWMIPRDRFPLNRTGYLQWRSELKQFHSDKAAEILRSIGYSPEIIERVQTLILKKDFPENQESRILEDALCLVFIEFQLLELAGKTEEEKVVNALRKSWRKMTPDGRTAALALELPSESQRLIQKALS